MEHTQAIDTVSQEAFEEAVQTYISWAAEWDGSLPADTFFGVWADLQKDKDQAPLAVKARIVEGRLELMAPPHSAIKATDNRIYLENGLELVIDLEPVG